MKFKEEQLIEYFKTRGVFIFNIFLLICIIGLLPVDNFLFDIFSHFNFNI